MREIRNINKKEGITAHLREKKVRNAGTERKGRGNKTVNVVLFAVFCPPGGNIGIDELRKNWEELKGLERIQSEEKMMTLGTQKTRQVKKVL